jgi:glyoxylase-like metal-dependent hydrolase (beta-lactamase superfamily II)
MEIYAIETGNFKLDGGAMFGVVPKSIWNEIYPADENNLCSWAMRCMLVVDGDRKILIDNGIGDKIDPKFIRNYQLFGEHNLEKSLNKIGYSPDDITDMVLTHLHFDHCGGSIKYNENKKLVPSFPNAIYHTSKQQWEWATNPNRREKPSFLKENIEPIMQSGKLNLFDKEHELFPDFYVKLLNGHTDGQVIPHITINGRTFVFAADFFPSMAHIPMPYIMAYDTRPLLTLEERKVFFETALKNDYILFFEHDIYHECCNLHDTEKGVRARESFTLDYFFGRN